MSSLWEVLKNTEKVKTENGTFFIRRHDRIKQLETENAKLRKLIRDLYVDMWDSGEWLEPYEQRMRELGIEVQE